jgi:hypothetical protein
VSDESTEVRCVAAQAIKALAMHELHGAGQMVVSTSQAADHDMLGTIALGDLGQAVGQGDLLAGRAGGHVAVGQRVRRGGVLTWERRQLAGQAEGLGLPPGRGVVSNQPGEAFMAEGAHVADAVDGMKGRVRQVGRIPDVVEPRSSNQVWLVLWGECLADALRLSSDPADVLPARRGPPAA